MSSPSIVSQDNDSLVTDRESDTTASSFSSQSSSQKPRYKSSYPSSWKLQNSKTISGGPSIPTVASKQNIAASNYNNYETLGEYGPSFPNKEQPRYAYGDYGPGAENLYGAYPGEDPREYLSQQDYARPAQFPQHPIGHPPNDPPIFRNYNRDYPPYPPAPTYAPGYPPPRFIPKPTTNPYYNHYDADIPKPTTRPYYNHYNTEFVDRTASKRSDGYDAPHQTSATSGYSTGPISGNSAAYNSASSRGSHSHDVPYTGIRDTSGYSAGAVVSNQNSAAAMPSIGEV